MSLFNFAKNEPVAITGTQALREAVYVRNKQRDLSRTARECNTSILALENFIEGSDLSVEIKQALTKELYGSNVNFNPATDRLVEPEVIAQPACTIGEIRYDPEKDPNSYARREARRQAVLAEQKPRKPTPEEEAAWRPRKRPGFA